MKKPWLPSVVIPAALVSFLLASTVHGQDAPATATPATRLPRPRVAPKPESAAAPSPEPAKAPVKWTWQLALAKMRSEHGPIYLRGSSAVQTIFVPISARMALRSALLHVELTNSISVLKERSQLAILLNDKVIAQVPLKPNEPEAALDVRLPVALLSPGYNRLQFRAVHHITDCEDPTSPELWTEVDALASYVALEGDLRGGPLRLSQLADLIDRKLWIWQPEPIRVLTAKSRIGSNGLAQGALVAQGAALRLDYLPLEVSHAVAKPLAETPKPPPADAFKIDPTSFRGLDAVLIGTAADLDPLLPDSVKRQIDDAFLGVFPQSAPEAHGRLVLVVSGRNLEEVTRAATAFAFTHFPMPDAPTMRIQANDLPQIADETARQSVHESGIYRFAHFGFHTVTVRGMSAEDFRIEMWFPPDLYAKQRADVELRLHLAYGAGFHPDSVLNVSLNDHFEMAVPLSDPAGGAYRDYRIDIPLRNFRPGRNELVLSARMMPSVTNKCLIFADNLRLTLFDDSQLLMPDASHYVRLPELELVARTGFPFTVKDDGSDLAIQVAGSSPRTIASAWMLAGKLAQEISTPLHRATVSFQPPKDARNLLVVGPVDKIDRDILAASPMPLGDVNNIPYPDPIGETLPLRHPSFLARWLPFWSPSEAAEAPSGEQTTARVRQVSELGDSVVTMMFESPKASKKTVLLLTATGVKQVSRGVERLLTPEMWGGLRGDITVWRDGPETIASQRAGKSYFVGHVKLEDRLLYDFSAHPWGLAAAVVLVVGLFVWLTRRLLGRFEEKRTDVVGEIR